MVNIGPVMSDRINILNMGQVLSQPVDLFALPALGLLRQWSAEPATVDAEIWIVLDPDALHFGASVTASSDYDADCGQGEFVEGLWERDVAELFIAEHEMYQEFNLSPNGAWWSAVFNAPRNRCAKRFSMPQDLKIFCETETDSWRVALSIPRNQFSLDLSFTSHTRLNCNVITGNPVRQYLSWCRLPGAEADFHQPQHFAVCSLCDQAS